MVTCKACGYWYEPKSQEEVKRHQLFCKKFQKAKARYGVLSVREANKEISRAHRIFDLEGSDLREKIAAGQKYCWAFYSRSFWHSLKFGYAGRHPGYEAFLKIWLPVDGRGADLLPWNIRQALACSVGCRLLEYRCGPDHPLDALGYWRPKGLRKCG